MSMRYLRRTGITVAALAVCGALTAVALAGGTSAATPLRIHAEFESTLVPAADQPADCPPPFLLVIGNGVGSGTHISNHAAGTAQECSLPTVDSTGTPIFDVHGKGTYTTPDGSVLYLIYHETSENPFVLPPPWTLHDRGQWDIDGNLSTGRFHGATGHGTIKADVPITCDEAFNCTARVAADYDGTISFSPLGSN
jgi:hypothetical protein